MILDAAVPGITEFKDNESVLLIIIIILILFIIGIIVMFNKKEGWKNEKNN